MTDDRRDGRPPQELGRLDAIVAVDQRIFGDVSSVAGGQYLNRLPQTPALHVGGQRLNFRQRRDLIDTSLERVSFYVGDGDFDQHHGTFN
jgi:hypothetical protein